MPKGLSSPTLETVKGKLRETVLALEDGALIGSEERLVSDLQVSRSTLRQAARMLEREGLLQVKRGVNGGYYGCRPDQETLEATVSAYMSALDMSYEDVTSVASVLWVEALRRAASLNNEAARDLAERYASVVAALTPDATFRDIVEIEQNSREEIFELAKSRYIRLIFHINQLFARGRFPRTSVGDATSQHRQFVHEWREAKLVELNAIARGNPELAMMAARNVRNIWHRRIWPRSARQNP